MAIDPPSITTSTAPLAKDQSEMLSPRLGLKTEADCEALRNDLAEAQGLASEFQRQVAGKSNELAEIRQVLEKTVTDLSGLQASIIQLRQERHALANRAMLSSALEIKLERSERARAESERAAVEAKMEVDRLAAENVRLLLEMATLKGQKAVVSPQDTPAMLAKILAAVEDLRGGGWVGPPSKSSGSFIEVSYE